jgi:pilus assembly protein CpaE
MRELRAGVTGALVGDMLCGVTVIVEADAAVAGRLAGPGALVLTDVDALRRYLDIRGSESVVILGPNVEMPSAAHLARWARVAHPRLAVIVARRGCTAAELRAALLAGVREVVDDRDRAALVTAVRRARAVARAMRSERDVTTGRVITVFGPRPGSGTTSLAINLAAALAQAGKRRVCLVDATPGSGDVATGLGFTTVPARTPAVSSDAHLGVDDVAAMVTPYAPGARDHAGGDPGEAD